MSAHLPPRLIPAVLLACAPLLAQYTTQQISGFVRDSSGGVILNARVSARHVETGLVRNASTTESGYYVIPNIPIGVYEISAEAAGFKRFQQTGVAVTVNSKPAVDVLLEVGAVTEQVSVTADAAMVETSTGEVGRLVTGEQATKLQLNGRNFAQLLFLLPGVSSTARSSFDLFGGFGSNMSSQSINGGRDYTYSWNIDGADNKDNGGGGNNFVNINPDAIAEFKVLTTNYSAEYGQNSGAVVNLALRSGTKELHGTVYEYVRNDAFDARAYNTLTKQMLRFNNFGANLGGPIVLPGGINKDRDKLFFFGGVEFKRLRRGSPNLWNVPALTQRSGDFSALPAAQQPRDPLNNNMPFTGGIIPAARFSPNSKRLVDLYPQPNFTGTGGNFNFFAPTPLDSNQYIAKVDYHLSEKHQLAVHWLRDYYTSLQNATQTVLYDRNIPGTNTSAKWTWVKNPTTVNTFQVTFTGNVIRQTDNFRANPIFVRDYTRQANGINYPMIYGNDPSIPTIAIATFTTLSTTPRQWNNFNRLFQGKYDFSKVRGNHNFKAGVLIMRSRKNQDNQPAVNGNFNFAQGHALHSGNPLADALLGNFNTYTEASSGREGWFRFTQAEFYAADNWKISTRLTLDLGLRYMLLQPQYAALQNAVVFAPRFYDSSKAPVVNRSDGLIVAGTGDPVNGLVVGGSQFPETAKARIPNWNDPLLQRLFRGLPKEISPYDYGTFGPRIGFAYDLTGRQRTVLRGGWGLFYERVQGNYVFGRVNNPPFIQESQVFSANVERPIAGATRNAPTNVSSYDIDQKVPTVQNWSFGVQHKLLADTVLDVAYVGSSAWNEFRQVNLNQLPLGTLQRNPGVNVQALRPYLGYGNISHLITGSNFNYHSLQAQLKKQMRGGGVFNIAYTWSRAMADATGYSEQAMDSYNFKSDYARTNQDRRHILVASYIYALPFWQRGAAWYKTAFGGWQLSGVTTVQTGRPLNITIPGDVAGIGQAGQRAHQISEWDVNAGTAARWFNPAAFTNPAAATWGNLGKNALTGPGTHNWDLSAQKLFRFTERMNLEFRAEVYNAPNHFSFWDVSSQVGSANFGQVTSASDPRTFQFGLRFAF